jgi:hypothetical protein
VCYACAECFRDAGLPDGVVNYVTGPGSTLGQALIESPEVDGVTFTGSYDVGMGIFRDFAKGRYVADHPELVKKLRSSPAMPILSARQSVLCARLSDCKARNALPVHGSLSKSHYMTNWWSGWWN